MIPHPQTFFLASSNLPFFHQFGGACAQLEPWAFPALMPDAFIEDFDFLKPCKKV